MPNTIIYYNIFLEALYLNHVSYGFVKKNLFHGINVFLFQFSFGRYFEKVREKEPYRDTMMEFYSTALWFLHKEKDLSALAHDLLQCDRYSPSTWCAAGNCVSMHKEHDVAIKFFERAVQVGRILSSYYVRYSPFFGCPFFWFACSRRQDEWVAHVSFLLELGHCVST